MRRTLAATCAMVTLGLLVPPTAAARQAYCSPSGDFCTSATLVGGKRTLRVGTFPSLARRLFGGRASICVDPPRRRPVRCIRRDFVRSGPIAQASAIWRRAFPNHGHGIYRVRFYVRAPKKTRLGPTLSFRV